MAEHNTIPSFMSASKTGITKELSYSGSSYTLTQTDSNGVLSDYTFTISGEGITETVATDANGELSVEDLVRGTCTVTEKTYVRYETQAAKTVTIDGVKNGAACGRSDPLYFINHRSLIEFERSIRETNKMFDKRTDLKMCGVKP